MIKGELVVITGCMFGRKSLELIEEIKNWEYGQVPYMAFSPIREEIFSRGSTHTIPAIHIPRDHSSFISYNVGTALRAGKKVEAVAIDEVSFYDSGIVEVVSILLDEGINVCVAGLDKDFRNKPFGFIGDLMALAVDVKKRYTVCMKCKKTMATTTQRLLADGLTPAPYSGQLIAVDGGETYKYECRCKDCHERA
jgi:thymidine kinase